MSKFIYTAKDAQNKEVSGSLDTTNIEEAEQLLKERDFKDIRLEEKVIKGGFSFFSSSLKPSEKLILIENLATMISSGIPIIEALETINQDSTNKHLNSITEGAITDLQRGQSLSETLRKFPRDFDKVFLASLEAGEASGKLDEVLFQLSENIKSDIELSQSVKNSLLYPALVVTVLIIVLSSMFVFVIPKVANVFTGLNIPLPLPTVILITFSNFFNKFLLYIIATVVILLSFIFFGVRSGFLKPYLFKLVTLIPILNSFFKKVDLARFARTFSLLLNSGVAIIEALNLSTHVVNNELLARDIGAVKNDISEGEFLSASLRKYKRSFPALLARLVSSGEKSGKLDKSLSDFYDFYQRQIRVDIKNFTTLLEPVLLVIIGIAIGGIILAIIAPIYQLIGQITPR